MSRVSGCLWLGVALILALVAGGAAFVTLQRATVTGQAAAVAAATTTNVVVAVHPMPVGVLLQEGDLTIQALPAAAAPNGAFATAAEVAGKISKVPLNTGEILLAHHVTEADIKSTNAAFTLPAGQVAVTLDATDLLSSISVAQPGDKVDILYSLSIKPTAASGSAAKEAGDIQQYTFGSLQNVTLVSIVRSALKEGEAQTANAAGEQTLLPTGPARAYVLALAPQDALVLKFLKDGGAVMDLALRNTADDTDHTTKVVDVRYLIDRFQLPVR